jgi:hypothetical protein
MTINIHPTYFDRSHFMREVSWRDRSGEFCWKVTCGARNVRQVLEQLAAEFGPITVVRHAQGPQWK